ncbi:helix-turn-helix domain-containing protein [Streptomyces sp. SID6673]|nr:helix-turn-helix domain-containing protein [Streptomyces sp. SID11726]NEB26410.1 helix-turn-helix domain-containing protein [Streptomyces sp. SID6673]
MAKHSRSASPPTARVLDVLDYLVEHRGQRWGLSELARNCEISKPTCLAILTELTARGYLRSHPEDKTYGLGPALVTAGRAARRDFALDPVVRDELDSLTRQFGVMSVASGRVGDQFMVLEVATPPGIRPPVSVGQTFPFALPTALMYVLWQPDEVLEHWVRGDHTWSAGLDLDELRRMAAECRSTGYLVEKLTPTLERVYQILGSAAADDLPPELRSLITDLLAGMGGQRVLTRDELRQADPGMSHRVGVIAAPTFDADGDQSLLLTVNVQDALTAGEIAHHGTVLKQTADTLTDSLGGRNPQA